MISFGNETNRLYLRAEDETDQQKWFTLFATFSTDEVDVEPDSPHSPSVTNTRGFADGAGEAAAAPAPGEGEGEGGGEGGGGGGGGGEEQQQGSGAPAEPGSPTKVKKERKRRSSFNKKQHRFRASTSYGDCMMQVCLHRTAYIAASFHTSYRHAVTV
jgi:hypothetical protein